MPGKKYTPFICPAVLVLVLLVSLSGCTGTRPPEKTINYTVVVQADTSPVPTAVTTLPVTARTPVVTTAVTTAFTSAVPSATSGEKTVAPTLTTPVPTPFPEPTVINSNGKTRWAAYTNYEDNFSVYKPPDWIVDTTAKSQISVDDKLTSSLSMNEYVLVVTPNLKGFIMIVGSDLSGTVFSLFDDPDKTRISDDFYNGMINGIESGFTTSETIKIDSVIRDSNYYLINGNPARHGTFVLMVNGQPLNADFYVITKGNRYYFTGYFAMDGSLKSDAETASDIMHTFIVH